VAMPLLIGKKKPAEINARASDMLKAVGLASRQPPSVGAVRRRASARGDCPCAGQQPASGAGG
jgi:ABC-type ATPase involved in cell division